MELLTLHGSESGFAEFADSQDRTGGRLILGILILTLHSLSPYFSTSVPFRQFRIKRENFRAVSLILGATAIPGGFTSAATPSE
jgi:hypothetical protein